MQDDAVADQVDQAVPVPRVVRKPGDLQIEQAQDDLLGSHRAPECQAPAPGHLLEVLGRRSVLLPALRENLGSMM